MSNKDKKNSTSFKLGHKEAEKWTKEDSISAFEELIEYADVNKSLSIQSAIIKSKIIPFRTFYYLLEKFPILHSYKKELENVVITTVNDMAILGEGNPTACIWRMKQLGERDEVVNNHQNNGKSFEFNIKDLYNVKETQ